MAHSRGSRFPRGGVSSRRRTSWNAGPFQVATELTSPGVTLWATGQQAVLGGLTLVRVRGVLQEALTVATTRLDGFRGIGHGICIVSANAFTAGVASVPAPIADMDWDGWLWHSLMNDLIGGTTTPTLDGTAEVKELVIDSKAMRKFRETDILIGVTETTTETGTASHRLSASTRILAKLA